MNVFLIIIALILILFRIIDNKCIKVYVNYSPSCLRRFSNSFILHFAQYWELSLVLVDLVIRL